MGNQRCLSLDILFTAKENLWDQGKLIYNYIHGSAFVVCRVGIVLMRGDTLKEYPF